ncbi:MAG: hypothetical protein K5751_03360 [Treponemataceae bacterium]|nr:hypothetical protein [Treponemataceae bacterium]
MTKDRLFRAFGEIAVIAGVVTAICFPVTAASCKINPEGITIIGGDYSSPKLLDFIVAGSDSLKLVFSDEIVLDYLYISPSSASEAEFECSKISMTSADLDKTNVENGVEYTLHMPEKTECGKEYVLFAEAEDKKGNTLSFSTAFYGYNEMVPKIILSEVRTEASKPKPEFVELYCLSGGNTGGMILEIAYNKTSSYKYTLPAAEVCAGEYIVIHLRRYDDQKAFCIDETDSEPSSLSASTATDSCPGSRDFWLNENAKVIGKTSVIMLWERSRGRMLDALLIAESGKENWQAAIVGEAAQSAFLADIWIDGDSVSNAVCSDKVTATRTVSRQNIAQLAADVASEDFLWPVPVFASDWIVVATSQATPGKENSSKPVQ